VVTTAKKTSTALVPEPANNLQASGDKEGFVRAPQSELNLEVLAQIIDPGMQTLIVSTLLENYEFFLQLADEERQRAKLLELVKIHTLEQPQAEGQLQARQEHQLRSQKNKEEAQKVAQQKFLNEHLPKLTKNISAANIDVMRPMVEQLANQMNCSLTWNFSKEKITCTGEIKNGKNN
jgi:hypothetical protein